MCEKGTPTSKRPRGPGGGGDFDDTDCTDSRGRQRHLSGGSCYARGLLHAQHMIDLVAKFCLIKKYKYSASIFSLWYCHPLPLSLLRRGSIAFLPKSLPLPEMGPSSATAWSLRPDHSDWLAQKDAASVRLHGLCAKKTFTFASWQLAGASAQTADEGIQAAQERR